MISESNDWFRININFDGQVSHAMRRFNYPECIDPGSRDNRAGSRVTVGNGFFKTTCFRAGARAVLLIVLVISCRIRRSPSAIDLRKVSASVCFLSFLE